MEELSAWTLELSRSLLAWWEMHARRDPEQKPWMFTPEGTWSEPYEHLNPYPIHVAEVIQWGEVPVVLEALGLGWAEVEEWAKRKEVPKGAAQQTIARRCEGGKFLGLSGDARIDELVSLAQAVPVRVPGGGTYGTVLSLVSNLSRALGAEEAAYVLHRAGHLDKEGRQSLEGLRQWCGTFEPDSERGAELLAWLAAWAEREHGWQRPVLHLQGVLQPTELVEPTPAAISEALWSMGGAMVVCRTGSGKTEGACAYVDRLAENWVGAKREFSVVAIKKGRVNGVLADELQLRYLNAHASSSGIIPLLAMSGNRPELQGFALSPELDPETVKRITLRIAS